MATVPDLIHNPEENKFSTAINSFLNRVQNLKGMVQVVQHLESKWTTNLGVSFKTMEDEPLFYGERFTFSAERLDQLTSIKSYLYIILVAQCVDSFEALLQGFIEAVSEGKKTQARNPLTGLLRKLFFKNKGYVPTKRSTNKMRLKYLFKQLNNETQFDQQKKDFLIFERVRHLTVHSDQVITDKSKTTLIDINRFDALFERIPFNENERITADFDKTGIIFEIIVQFAFSLFEQLSLEFKLPIRTTNN